MHQSELVMATATFAASGIGVYVGLSVKAGIADVRTSIAALETKLTGEARDREDRMRDWADRVFARAKSQAE